MPTPTASPPRRPLRLATRDYLTVLQRDGVVLLWRESRLAQRPAFTITSAAGIENTVPLRHVRAYLDGLTTAGHAPADVAPTADAETAVATGLVRSHVTDDGEWFMLGLPSGEVYSCHADALLWFTTGLAARGPAL